MNTKFIRILVLLVSVTVLLSSCLNLEFFNGVPVSADTSEITQDLSENTREKETEKETEAQTATPTAEAKPIVKNDFVINKNTGKRNLSIVLHKKFIFFRNTFLNPFYRVLL